MGVGVPQSNVTYYKARQIESIRQRFLIPPLFLLLGGVTLAFGLCARALSLCLWLPVCASAWFIHKADLRIRSFLLGYDLERGPQVIVVWPPMQQFRELLHEMYYIAVSLPILLVMVVFSAIRWASMGLDRVAIGHGLYTTYLFRNAWLVARHGIAILLDDYVSVEFDEMAKGHWRDADQLSKLRHRLIASQGSAKD